ncbi:MAG: amidohydrolase family protein [Actinomycetes bacterium]
MAHDLVIRGGTVVDGTGAPARPADVAVDGDTVVMIGPVDGRGRREIDAEGRIVTPGFVDVHTHLDAQFAWDPHGTSSCWHGVTSVVVGNCGVGFAPVRAHDRAFLAEMMESVEDIPRDSVLDGLPWDWESYGGYLDWLERIPKGMHVGAMVGHAAVRYAALGEAALDPDATVSPDDLAVMVDLVAEAAGAGALGFSTSRTLRHRVPDGRFVPGTWAGTDELTALARAVTGRVLEVAPRFDGDGPAEPRVDEELAWMASVSRAVDVTITYNVTQTREQGWHFRRALNATRAANARGARLRPQTSPRWIGVLTGIAHRTPFDAHAEWRDLWPRSLTERLAVLRDPAQRARLVDAARADLDGLDEFFVLNGADGAAHYDTATGRSLAAVAARRGVSPVEAFIDLTLETDGALVCSWPLLNQRIDAVAEMIADPLVMIGLGDAGAHVGQTMDASGPTTLLATWVRDRAVLPLEEGIRRLTADTARVFGLDRGVLRPGAVADVNVIDLDALACAVPEFRHDLPHGAGRWIQRSRGYDATLVAGEVAVEHGECTDARAGRVLRAGRR